MEQPASNFGSAKLSQALYEARSAALDDIVANRLMDAAAKAQKIERSALIEKEITAKITPVTDAEITAWYQANQGRLQGAPLEQVRQPIRSYLTQERMQEVRAAFVDWLKAKTAVSVMLDPPRQKVEMVVEPHAGTGERAGGGGRVLRLPVTVLPEGRSDPHTGVRHLRRSHPFRLSRIPAAQPPVREGRRPKPVSAPTSRGSSGRITIGCSRTSSA